MQRPPNRKRPRKRRHWPIVGVGSDLWWRQARWFGVQQRQVEATLETSDPRGREAIDPHAIRHDASSAARAATHLLLFQSVPTYACLMYVTHAWSSGGRSLKEWIVAQYAYFIDCGTDAQREAALYSLWVDYFEVPERAAFVFPRLLNLVENRGELLRASGPVPWALKRDAYLEAAQDPALHAALARGLTGSFYDVFGSVDAPEARDLFRRIEVRDDALRHALRTITTEPMLWKLVGVVTVDQRDERWTRWLPRHRESTEPSFLVLLRAPTQTTNHWVPGSGLYHQRRLIGALVHHTFPFDREIAHRIYGSWDPAATLFRVDGIAAAARDAIGDLVESWPEGLGPPVESSS